MYGVQETNPITPEMKAARAKVQRVVDWTADGLTITRLRLISDPGFPAWDVSYCYGEINGEMVRVNLPFSQLDKRKWKSELFQHAKDSGKFIKGLFSAISTLN